MAELKMPQINDVRLSGRLVRDADLKYTSTGKAMVRCAIAVDQGFGDKKITEFYDVKAWEKLAEKFAPQMKKGAPEIIEGRLVMERWEGKEGEHREKLCIDVYRMYCLSWGDEPRDTPKAPPQSTQHDTAKSNGYAPEQQEDDIPF